MTYYESSSTDPAYNLALEQYLFDTGLRGEVYIMLWQNDNAIVVGKYQNAMAEVNSEYVREHGVRIVRRLSGGGAVYHDLGNINYTVIADDDNNGEINFSMFCEPVIRTLAKLGVKAEISGRNDICIDGKKISGSAQLTKAGRVMHHGTLLFESNLDVVASALSVSKDKYKSKAVASVKARVANISDFLMKSITLNQFKDALKTELCGGKGVAELELSALDIEAILSLKEKRYDTWEWNIGATPQYSMVRKRNIEGCGTIEIHLDVKNGIITLAAIYGDFFGSGNINEVTDRLVGCKLRSDALGEALSGLSLSYYFRSITVEQLIELLLG